jgi:hypothetical protein
MGNRARAALPAVVALLDASKDAELRIRAIQAIEKIGDLDPGAVPALKRASEDKDKTVAAQAKKALRALEKAAKAKHKTNPKGKKNPKPIPRKKGGKPAQPLPPEDQDFDLDPAEDLGA